MTGGIGPDVEKVAAVLNQLLADEFLQNIEFSLEHGRTAIYSLHRCLEEQSHQLRMMIASVAEGTRKTGHFTWRSTREFLDAASFKRTPELFPWK